jgi:hypothetical protein
MCNFLIEIVKFARISYYVIELNGPIIQSNTKSEQIGFAALLRACSIIKRSGS